MLRTLTWRPVKRAHDAESLCIRRERDTLSHRVDARDRPVMEPSMLFRVSELLVNTAHFANNSPIQIEDNLPSKCGRHPPLGCIARARASQPPGNSPRLVP